MSAYGTRYAEDISSLMQHISDWQDQYAGKTDETFPCVQQRITGSACGFFALYDHGTCRQYFMHRRVREIPASGGPSSCAESIHERDLLEAGMSLLDALDWHGVAMVEFLREESTNELYLIEINPKFWGSLELSYASGINFPYGAVLLAAGRPLPESVAYTVGKRFQWFLPEELKHLRTSPRSLFPVIGDLLDWRTGSNFWVSDPLPTLGYIWNKAGGLARPKKRK